MAVNIVDATCIVCGVNFERYIRPSRSMPKCCSQTCAGKMHVGDKHTPERIARRVKYGADHPHWVGDKAQVKSGRTRAGRMFPAKPQCESCGEIGKRIDRHHVDGDTLNNTPENIQFLCRRCHMTADGRINRMSEVRYGQRR